MCEYCKNVKTGNDYNPLLTADVDLGFAGKLILDAVLVNDKDTGGAALALFGCMDYKDTEFGKYFAINYCPVCGEKL